MVKTMMISHNQWHKTWLTTSWSALTTLGNVVNWVLNHLNGVVQRGKRG